MTKANVNTTAERIIRNGFEVVTRNAILQTLERAMIELDTARTMSKALSTASESGSEIARLLAEQVTSILDIVHNDIDCLSECAAKAGVTGELVTAGCRSEVPA